MPNKPELTMVQQGRAWAYGSVYNICITLGCGVDDIIGFFNEL